MSSYISKNILKEENQFSLNHTIFNSKIFHTEEKSMLTNGGFSNLSIVTVRNKNVYIFDKHHFALPIWALGIDNNKRPINLISFDYHTDTVAPFNKYAFKKIYREGLNSVLKDVFEQANEIQIQRLNQIDSNDLNSLLNAVEDLEHDEHITTAHDIGIINQYHILNKSDETPMFNDEYLYKNEFYNYELNEIEHISCLDDEFINQSGFNKPIGPFILDFDLDYFPTRKSFNPINISIIKELIEEAEIITITREKECFDDLKHEDMDVQEAERLLLELITRILLST